jgi:hypothetical protein
LRSITADWAARVDDLHLAESDWLRERLEGAGAVLIGWRELREAMGRG